MDEGVDPTTMCRSLVEKISQSEQLRSVTDPEILILFEDWLEELENEAAETIKRRGSLTPKRPLQRVGFIGIRGIVPHYEAQKRRQDIGFYHAQISEPEAEMAIQVNWKKLWLPLLAIAITVGVLWFTNRAVTPREPKRDDVVAEASGGGYRLIKTDELKQRYEKEPPERFVGGHPSRVGICYGSYHGSVNFPMEPTAWSRWQKKGKLAEALGPDKNRFIVFY